MTASRPETKGLDAMAVVIDRWQAKSIRWTFFLSEPVPADKRPSAKSYGVAFESQQTSATGEVVEIASYGVGKIALSTNANRVDLNWNAEPHPENDVSLGASREALDAALTPVISWLRDANLAITRVALGGDFRHAVGSVDEGYQRLAELLPTFPVDRNNMEDFALQVNRVGSVSFRGDKLRINRICRWAVNVQQATMFEFGPGGPVFRTLPEEYAVSCGVDFNTDARGVNPPMASDEVTRAAEALVANVLAFLEQGDHVEHH
ncbi:MAG TPA: hypothetical protein VGD21_09175 [Lysobacter sp.]